MHRAELIGYIANDKTSTIRVLVPQSEIELVLDDTAGVDLRFVSRPMKVLHVNHVSREVPAATRQLPSVALSTADGDPIAATRGDDKHLPRLRWFFRWM